MDSETTVAKLKEQIRVFCDERDWDQYHNAKDLAIGIITEAGELLDHFRFKSNSEINEFMKNQEKKSEISEEISDIVYFVLRLAQKYEIDITTELNKKLEKNAEKYPIHKSRGSNKKYTEL